MRLLLVVLGACSFALLPSSVASTASADCITTGHVCYAVEDRGTWTCIVVENHPPGEDTWGKTTSCVPVSP